MHVSRAIAADAVDNDVGLASITEIAYLKRREKVATTNGKEMNEWKEQDVTHRHTHTHSDIFETREMCIWLQCKVAQGTSLALPFICIDDITC